MNLSTGNKSITEFSNNFFGIGSATGAPIHYECILSLIYFLVF